MKILVAGASGAIGLPRDPDRTGHTQLSAGVAPNVHSRVVA
jgi:hypothetical protein